MRELPSSIAPAWCGSRCWCGLASWLLAYCRLLALYGLTALYTLRLLYGGLPLWLYLLRPAFVAWLLPYGLLLLYRGLPLRLYLLRPVVVTWLLPHRLLLLYRGLPLWLHLLRPAIIALLILRQGTVCILLPYWGYLVTVQVIIRSIAYRLYLLVTQIGPEFRFPVGFNSLHLGTYGPWCTYCL